MSQFKKKVIFFLPGKVGGAERMTVTIAKMLPQDEFEVIFVIVGRGLGDIVKFIPTDYPLRQIPLKSIWCGGTMKLWKMIRKERPDIVFSSLLYLNVRLILVAKLCGVKVIVRNNIDLSRTTHKINIPLVRLTYKWADKVIAQQEEMHDEIISYTRIPVDMVFVSFIYWVAVVVELGRKKLATIVVSIQVFSSELMEVMRVVQH